MTNDNLDTIIIDGLSLKLSIGCTAQERSQAQQVLLDIKISKEPPQEAISGNLSKTIDYENIVNEVKEFSQSKEWILLEDLLEEVCHLIFTNNPQAQTVKAQAKKFVLEDTNSVGVQILRKG